MLQEGFIYGPILLYKSLYLTFETSVCNVLIIINICILVINICSCTLSTCMKHVPIYGWCQMISELLCTARWILSDDLRRVKLNISWMNFCFPGRFGKNANTWQGRFLQDILMKKGLRHWTSLKLSTKGCRERSNNFTSVPLLDHYILIIRMLW